MSTEPGSSHDEIVGAAGAQDGAVEIGDASAEIRRLLQRLQPVDRDLREVEAEVRLEVRQQREHDQPRAAADLEQRARARSDNTRATVWSTYSRMSAWGSGAPV